VAEQPLASRALGYCELVKDSIVVKALGHKPEGRGFETR
jgi:hypothetical protein